MTHDPHEILSAFVDGEPVDTAALAEALAGPGAREALLDFVLLRAAVCADDARPSDRLAPRIRRVLGAKRRWAPLAAAAAALVVAVAGGGWWTLHERAARRDAPPEATQTIVLECGRDWQCKR
jgi:hypothetical protein